MLNYQKNGGYQAQEYYHYDRRIRQVTDQLVNGFFTDTEGEFTAIYDSLLDHNDQYFVLRDFSSYVDIQRKVSQEYQIEYGWLEKSLINIAKSGYFTSDRTIKAYAEDIWNLNPIIIK